MPHPSQTLVLTPSVAEALESGKPVVALESTIITHGMPYPSNLETALAVESKVKEKNAVPATIAVIEGKLHIGLNQAQLEQLAQTRDAMKLSRADFAYAISQQRTGSTTVAATMMAAELAGISVFATGGIGGVHRGAETSFDISADLEELANTNVIVVCAGAKAILDLNKTFELLETNGVPVIGYDVDEIPAFWSRESGLTAPLRLNSAAEIAGHAKVRAEFGIRGGTLITNPVPKDAEIVRDDIRTYIEQALGDAEKANISGKNVTPYLLGRMFELTGGKSLETNIALVLNNAELAAEIAVELSKSDA